MPMFAIIEIEDGLTVAELATGETPEDKAVKEGGVVIDPGPYYSREDAYDAMQEISAAAEEPED